MGKGEGSAAKTVETVPEHDGGSVLGSQPGITVNVEEFDHEHPTLFFHTYAHH
jgi:hypothetical protein